MSAPCLLNPNRAPIGVFDSGVGGFSVLRHVLQTLPHEAVIYCADTRYAPYGEKTEAEIRQRAEYMTRFLMAHQAKAIVLACNTATVAAVAHLRAHFTLPIIGMEPAIKPAVAATRSGVIGVLATAGTLQSTQFSALLEHYGHGVSVVTQACHGLVECIERGEFDTPGTRGLVARYVEPLLARGADTLVLGCTHYPLIRTLVADIAGPDVTLIDTGAAVARQLQHRLAQAGLLGQGEATLRCFVSGSVAASQPVMEQLWGGPLDVTPMVR